MTWTLLLAAVARAGGAGVVFVRRGSVPVAFLLIAEEEARRRINEGIGVKNLFAELPRGFTASQIRKVLAAMADKTRAEALMKAVETGHVKVVVMNGGAQPALQMPNGLGTKR